MPMTQKNNEIRDLIDFFQHWPDAKERVKNYMNDTPMPSDITDTLELMIFIIDRIDPTELS
jgi:hypothetical protein